MAATPVTATPKVKSNDHTQVTNQQDNPSVRMLRNSRGIPMETSLKDNSPATCSASFCPSNVADSANVPSEESQSWGSCSHPSFLEYEMNAAESVKSQDYLLQAAQEITKELGHTMVCAIGGLPKSGKFIRSGHTFRRWMVTVDFDDVSLQKYGQLII